MRAKVEKLQDSAKEWTRRVQHAITEADEAYEHNATAQRALAYCLRQSDIAEQQSQRGTKAAERAAREANALSLSRQEISL